MAVALGYFAREHAAASTVGVMNDGLQAYRSTAIKCGLRFRDQLAIEDVLDLLILWLSLIDGGAFLRRWLGEQLGEVEALGLPMLDQLAAVEHLHLPDHLVEGAEAELDHQPAYFLGDKEEIVDDVLGLALETLAQHGVLRRDPDGTGVQVTLAHHDATGGDQRRGGEAEFVCAEQRAHHHVAAGSDAAIHLHGNAAAQAVDDERLMGFGEPDFPRASGVLDRGERGRASAALETGDGDVISARF